MKTKIFFLAVFSTIMLSCSSDDDNTQPPTPEPNALEVSAINGFVSTGPSTFQVTNLLNNEVTSDLQVTSPFFVIFSKPVKNDWLANTSLPRITLIEDGESVAGVNFNLTVQSSTELLIEPNEELEPGKTYRIGVNAGYEASDNGILEDGVFATFTTKN